jgi:hypothetical protein
VLLMIVLAPRLLSSEIKHSGTNWGGGIGTIELDLSNGSVTIVGVANRTSVEISQAATTGLLSGSVEMRLRDGSLRIHQRCPTLLGFRCRADLDLQVPDGVFITGGTSNGAIRASHLSGDLDIRTSNGAISLEDMTGRLNGRTSNGAIFGENIGSPSVTFQTSNGSITMDFASPPAMVDLRTSNGAIRIDLPSDAPAFAVSTTTSNGRIDTSVRTDPASSNRIDARTSNGNITIRYR